MNKTVAVQKLGQVWNIQVPYQDSTFITGTCKTQSAGTSTLNHMNHFDTYTRIPTTKLVIHVKVYNEFALHHHSRLGLWYVFLNWLLFPKTMQGV